jgi:hypothetical protein
VASTVYFLKNIQSPEMWLYLDEGPVDDGAFKLLSVAPTSA